MPRLEVRGPVRGIQVYPRRPYINRQNIHEIRDRCFVQNQSFEDPEFPADDTSLKDHTIPVQWRRPTEICAAPQWKVDTYTRFDVIQGQLGDCWLLAAVACLTCNHQLLDRVVPPDQSFQDGYCGVFRFRLWYQGEWVDVIVDDRLPTRNLQTPNLLYMHSKNNSEFWSALLEKAYAKLYGGYRNIHGGSAIESLEDFTGGLGETIHFLERPGIWGEHFEYLRDIIIKTLQRGGLVTCAKTHKSSSTTYAAADPAFPDGLLYDHSYSVTRIARIHLPDDGTTWLLRLRNPWGNDQEWTGAWSDRSDEWNRVPKDLRRQLSLKFEEDGEFWMSFQDFTKHFTKLEICNLDPLQIEDGDIYTCRWDTVSYHKSWIAFVNSGGCLNHKDSMWKNPQFLLTLTEPDDRTSLADDSTSGSGLCTVIVALMQKDRRRDGLPYLNIGYAIYELPSGHEKQTLDRKFFNRPGVRPVAKMAEFPDTREVSGRHRLPPGSYVIIPSTFSPNQSANFLLRIFTEKPKSSREMDERTTVVELEPVDYTDGAGDHHELDLSDVAEHETIDAYTLKNILNSWFKPEFTFPGFSLDVCRSLIAMMDTSMSGSLGRERCMLLSHKLLEWQTIFNSNSEETKGYISSYHVRPLLKSAGIQVSNITLQTIILRYVNKDGSLEFLDVVACLAKLTTLLELFKDDDTEMLDKILQAAFCC